MGIIISMNDETYTPCTKCGRPMAYCKGQCCGQPKGCSCQEYGPMKAGCLREIEPSCPYQAVIPTLTVEDKSNLKDLADCFVHVSNINTTFYIDDKHRTIVTWAGPVEYDNYDLDANSLGLRSQFLIDHANDLMAYYTKTGEYQIIGGADDEDPISFTMQYSESTRGNILPGWHQGDATETVAEINNGGVRRNIKKMEYIYYAENESPSVTFKNDKTGDVMTPQAFYELLVSGADVVLNHVPLGFRLAVEEEYGEGMTYVDGVKLSRLEVAPIVNESSDFNIHAAKCFTGSAFVSTIFLTYLNIEERVMSNLGISLLGQEGDNNEWLLGTITVQGFVMESPLN